MEVEISNSIKEVRANLQRQAYGKVYAHCNVCYLPLIPISKAPRIEGIRNKIPFDRFMRCCPNGSVLFCEENDIQLFREI